jgi:hypothetical protein
MRTFWPAGTTVTPLGSSALSSSRAWRTGTASAAQTLAS